MPDTVNGCEVAVVGGGASGLAAAGYLQRHGIKVCVLEQQPEPGGRLTSVSCSHGVADTGAAFLCNHFTRIMKILKKAGLGKDIVPIGSPMGIYFNGKIVNTPVNPFNLLTTPVLGGRDKMKLAALLPGLYRLWSRTGNGYIELDGNSALNNKNNHLLKLARWDETSLADYADKHLSRNILEKFIYPATSPFYFWTPENTSRAANIPGFVLATGGKIFAMRRGMGVIAAALAGGARVYTGVRVINLTKERHGWELELTVQERRRTLKAKCLILAVTAPRAAELLAGTWARGAGIISEFTYTPSIVTIFCLASRLKLPWYGVTALRNDFSFISTITMQSNKLEELTRPGKEMITVYLTGPASSQLINKADEHIARQVLPEVEVVLGRDITTLIDHLHVYRWKLGQPENPVGHFKRLWRLKNTPLPEGLQLAGDYFELPCTEGAVCAGLAAARAAVQSG